MSEENGNHEQNVKWSPSEERKYYLVNNEIYGSHSAYENNQ